jgi:hypothetical protein
LNIETVSLEFWNQLSSVGIDDETGIAHKNENQHDNDGIGGSQQIEVYKIVHGSGRRPRNRLAGQLGVKHRRSGKNAKADKAEQGNGNDVSGRDRYEGLFQRSVPK